MGEHTRVSAMLTTGAPSMTFNSRPWISSECEITSTGLDAKLLIDNHSHHVLTLLLGGKLHLAPLPLDIKTAVDIGTGTGMSPGGHPVGR